MSGATAAATVRSGQKQNADEAEDEDGTQHAKQFLLQATPSQRHSADYHRDSVRRTTSKGEQENNGAKVEEERKQNVEPLEAVHQKEEEVGKVRAHFQPNLFSCSASGLRFSGSGLLFVYAVVALPVVSLPAGSRAVAEEREQRRRRFWNRGRLGQRTNIPQNLS